MLHTFHHSSHLGDNHEVQKPRQHIWKAGRGAGAKRSVQQLTWDPPLSSIYMYMLNYLICCTEVFLGTKFFNSPYHSSPTLALLLMVMCVLTLIEVYLEWFKWEFVCLWKSQFTIHKEFCFHYLQSVLLTTGADGPNYFTFIWATVQARQLVDRPFHVPMLLTDTHRSVLHTALLIAFWYYLYWFFFFFLRLEWGSLKFILYSLHDSTFCYIQVILFALFARSVMIVCVRLFYAFTTIRCWLER